MCLLPFLRLSLEFCTVLYQENVTMKQENSTDSDNCTAEQIECSQLKMLKNYGQSAKDWSNPAKINHGFLKIPLVYIV